MAMALPSRRLLFGLAVRLRRHRPQRLLRTRSPAVVVVVVRQQRQQQELSLPLAVVLR